MQSVAPTLPTPEEKTLWANPDLNLKRLDALIHHMEKMPEGAFFMGNWFHRMGEDEYVSDFELTKVEALTVVETQLKAGPKHKGAPLCGTTACIAGEVVLLEMARAAKARKAPNIDRTGSGSILYADSAQKLLGLRSPEARALFIPSHKGFDDITKKEAIRVLKYLRETGEVSWQVPKNWRPRYTPYPATGA